MFDNSDFMELLIVAAIAAALVYKFFITLGEKRGFESTPVPDTIFGQSAAENSSADDEFQKEIQLVPQEFHPQIEEIRRIDRNFSPEQFIGGASVAFEMIIEAYSKGNRETLQTLLNENVYAEFDAAMTERENNQHELSTTLVKLAPVIIESINVHKDVATVTLKYTSEQTNILYDNDRKILEGGRNQVEEVIDVWTFSRELRSSNPNWLLVETGA